MKGTLPSSSGTAEEGSEATGEKRATAAAAAAEEEEEEDDDEKGTASAPLPLSPPLLPLLPLLLPIHRRPARAPL